MKDRTSLKNAVNILGIVSLAVALIIFLPILNWLFKITPYQDLEGMPLLIAPFVSPVGIIFGIISVKVSCNKFGKLGIISNIVLFLLPFLYWYLGIFILGV